MATAKAAFNNQSAVGDAAAHAYSQFMAAAEAGGAMIGGLVQQDGEAPADFASRAMKEFGGFGDDFLWRSAVHAGTDGIHLVDAARVAYTASYLADADAALVGLEGDFRHLEGVGHGKPSDLANLNAQTYRDQVEIARQKADFADAFTPFAGDGSAVDGALRTGLKMVHPAKVALEGLEVVGNGAQAYYHLQSGLASLDAANKGVVNVYAGAYGQGVGR